MRPSFGSAALSDSAEWQRPWARGADSAAGKRDVELVAHHGDLDLLGIGRPQAQQEKFQHAANGQLDEGPDHDLSPPTGKTDHGSSAVSGRELPGHGW